MLTDQDIARQLTALLETNDLPGLIAFLSDTAKAQGMTEIAKATGLSRESLYKALRQNAQPRFETISKVCHALGVKLIAAPRETV